MFLIQRLGNGEIVKKEQSLAGVIRERLESIEQRLAVGVRQEVLLTELAQAGYETSLSNFRNELWRARKRKEKKEQGIPDATKAPQSSLGRPAEIGLHSSQNPSSTIPEEFEIPARVALGGIPKKSSLEKRASQYIKGSLGEQSIDNLLKPKKKD